MIGLNMAVGTLIGSERLGFARRETDFPLNFIWPLIISKRVEPRDQTWILTVIRESSLNASGAMYSSVHFFVKALHLEVGCCFEKPKSQISTGGS
jgi:hypothetical protein